MNTDIMIQPVSYATQSQIAYAGVVPWARAILSTIRVQAAPEVPMLVRSALEVRASSAIGRPLSTCVTREQCGRIYLVAFTPHRSRSLDPILPLSLIPMGAKYDKALRAFAGQILEFWPHGGHEKWWARARRRCDACLRALERVASRLTIEELAYTVLMLEAALAWPRGREEGGAR